jgi:hypothetical protein
MIDVWGEKNAISGFTNSMGSSRLSVHKYMYRSMSVARIALLCQRLRTAE